MTVGQWMDTAWALIMRQTPMMANPFEYRETLWDLLYEGEKRGPSKPVGGDRPAVRRGRRPRALGPGAGQGLSRRDSNDLNSFRDELMALRAKREAERGSPLQSPATS